MQIFTSLVQLPPGLYVLRHPGKPMPPLSITEAPHSKAVIDVLTARSGRGLVLENGADCIVMRVANAPAELLVAAFASQQGAVEPAIKVDRIALDAPARPQPPQSPATPPVMQPATPRAAPAQKQLVIKDKGISIVGHVERLGDVVAGEGEVFGDTAAMLRVGGFQVMWPDRPDGVDLAYTVAFEGGTTVPAVRTGQFVGVRRDPRRITEVSFALIGPNAARYQLEGLAHFSGGYQVPLRTGVAQGGPSGLEHLTALALRVVAASTAPIAAQAGAPRTKAVASQGAAPAQRAAKAEVKSKPAQKAAKPAPKKKKV